MEVYPDPNDRPRTVTDNEVLNFEGQTFTRTDGGQTQTMPRLTTSTSTINGNACNNVTVAPYNVVNGQPDGNGNRLPTNGSDNCIASAGQVTTTGKGAANLKPVLIPLKDETTGKPILNADGTPAFLPSAQVDSTLEDTYDIKTASDSESEQTRRTLSESGRLPVNGFTLMTSTDTQGLATAATLSKSNATVFGKTIQKGTSTIKENITDTDTTGNTNDWSVAEQVTSGSSVSQSVVNPVCQEAIVIYFVKR